MQDRAAVAAALLLVVLLGIALANLTWALMPISHETPPPVNRAPTSTGTASSGPDYRQIARLHLFGEARPEQVTQAPINAPDTRLNVNLRGILFNSHNDRALAIIAIPGSGEDHFRAGQEIRPGVKIDHIYPDRVILLREGRHETLRLPEKRLETATAQAPRANSRTSMAGPPGGGGTTTTLAHYRERLIAEPNQAHEFIRAEPVETDGQLRGFRLSPGADTSLFQAAGLHEGDIVTAVNGVQLDALDKGLLAMEELANAAELELQVIRGGQQETLRLQLQE